MVITQTCEIKALIILIIQKWIHKIHFKVQLKLWNCIMNLSNLSHRVPLEQESPANPDLKGTRAIG